jgi:iron complex transport system substrate-binding protein
MKLTLSIFIVFILLFSCTEQVSTDNLNDLKSVKNDTLKNDFAASFRIVEHSESTEIQIIDIENDVVEFTYFFSDSEKESNALEFNPDRVVALSATHIGMFEELELLDKIVGISDGKYLCSSKLKKRVHDGLTRSIGDIGMADIEGYIDVDPDLVIYSGFDTKAPILKKLKSAGIKTFTNYDWKETHPLGRAEWLKVFGVMFNKRIEAEELFDKIKTEYLSLVKEVKQYSSNETVLVGTMYGDIFNAPAGDSYMAKILKDANLNYKYQETEGTGSISLTLEEVISDNRKTNIWLNVAAKSKDKVLEMNNRFRLLESIENNRVYSYYHEVNCFWEKSAISPHLLLKDICKIVHPDEFKDEVFNFYKKID